MADNVEEILSINVENLKEKQVEALRKHIVQKLVDLAKFINTNDDFTAKQMQTFLSYSPAGDGMGCDNHYINFGFGKSDNTKNLDLYQILNLMMTVKHEDRSYFEMTGKR